MVETRDVANSFLHSEAEISFWSTPAWYCHVGWSERTWDFPVKVRSHCRIDIFLLIYDDKSKRDLQGSAWGNCRSCDDQLLLWAASLSWNRTVHYSVVTPSKRSSSYPWADTCNEKVWGLWDLPNSLKPDTTARLQKTPPDTRLTRLRSTMLAAISKVLNLFTPLLVQ